MSINTYNYYKCPPYRYESETAHIIRLDASQLIDEANPPYSDDVYLPSTAKSGFDYIGVAISTSHLNRKRLGTRCINNREVRL